MNLEREVEIRLCMLQEGSRAKCEGKLFENL